MGLATIARTAHFVRQNRSRNDLTKTQFVFTEADSTFQPYKDRADVWLFFVNFFITFCTLARFCARGR